MDELILIAETDEHRLEIVQDTLGYYIYRYAGEERICTHDYLQDDLEAALFFARDRFKMAVMDWREATPEERQKHKDG